MFYRFHSFSYWILKNLRIRLKWLRQIHWAYNFIRINFSIQFKRRHNKIIATMMAHLKWHHFWSFPLKLVHMTKKNTNTEKEKKTGRKKTSRHFGHDFYVFMSYFSLFASRNLAKIYFFIQVFFFFCFYIFHVFFSSV